MHKKEINAMPLDQIVVNINPNAQLLLAGVIALLIFGVSLDLRVRDFVVIFDKPLVPLVGVVAQCLLLPAFTWGLTMLMPMLGWHIPASVALGMILVGSCPGGSTSNVITHFAKGNVAMSVAITGISSIAAVITTPLNTLFWAGLNPSTAALMKTFAIDPWEFLLSLTLSLALPLAAGMALAHYVPRVADKLKKPMQIFAFGFLVLFILAAAGANAKNFAATLATVFPVIIVHNASALLLGWVAATLAGADEPNRRAISIEVGMQNSGLGLAIIFAHFKGLGGAAVVAAGWGIWHIVSGLVLAWWWRRKNSQ
jgi:bile acid:Na+ symporter, BASS family